MTRSILKNAAVATSLLSVGCLGQTSCPSVLTPSYPAAVANGYSAQLITTGLTKPRGIILDNHGALLVVQQGSGIQHLTFTDYGGTCLVLNKSTTLLSNSDLTHGIELSSDGNTLYASSSQEVYSWSYDALSISLSNQRTLVQNMSNEDHTTRTLLLSKKQPDLLLVSRGSGENIDALASQQSSGRSQIRVFNVTNSASVQQAYDYPSQGELLGWGLRNSVGVAEDPVTGAIYSVENSADELWRLGADIHEDDPGEEMNFHGFLNGSTEGNQGGNFGYPNCFSLWSTNVPDVGSMETGNQFAVNQSTSLNDTTCAESYVSPRLTFQAHMAPLDMKFTANGALAYITFHGSWDRKPPVGYKLSAVTFENGSPTEPNNSTAATVDILVNANISACPDSCVRPVGLAIDSQGRIFMSSDKTGEIYVLKQSDMSATGIGTASGTNRLVSSPSRTSANAAPGFRIPHNGELLGALTVALSLVGGMFFIAA